MKNLIRFIGICVFLGLAIILTSVRDYDYSFSEDIDNFFESDENTENEDDQKTVATTEQTTELTTERISPEDAKWYEYSEEIDEEVSYEVPEGVDYPYFIKVNRAANCVTVYGIDDKGDYSIPVKAFACSCGREGHETITGENYVTSDKYDWRYMVDGTYGRCAIRIWNSYMFHSVPYIVNGDGGSLEEGEYNKLGDFSSMGCVRLCYRDVKWIYDNCKSGTKVTIYDDANNPGPLGKPDTIKVPEDSEFAGWDPTDPDENNPWKNSSAKIEGVNDITVSVGEEVNVLDGLKAYDTCGNDITDKIQIIGKYTFDIAGTYNIKFKVVDAIGSTATSEMTLTVE